MIPLIKELVKKATVEKQWDKENERWIDRHVDQAKFAELIVKECMMVVEGFEITQEVALDEYVDYEASAVLKQYFGVEL